MTDEIAIRLGFANADEFFALTATLDLSSQRAVEKFKAWQLNDGTKAGLLAVFPELSDERD